MSKKEKATLLPRLRFNEFSSTGDWNQFTLEKVADRITEKVGDKQLTTLSISAGVGFVSQAEKFSRDISGKQYANYICLRKGDFSYNKGNSKKFPQGCIYELVEYEEAAVPSAFISFHFKESYVPNFYKGYFDNNFHGKQLTRFITSGARMDGLLNIRPSDFFSIVLPTPKEKEEQQKIADCLSSLDGLITAEDKKLSALKDHKKGLMQKLFPAEGETVPEWRFPEFRDSGEWEEKILLQVVTSITNGLSMEQVENSKGYAVTRIETISDQTINIKRVGHVQTAQDISSYKLNIGDILFSNINSLRQIGKVAIIEKDYDLYHGMNLLRLQIVTKQNSPKFMFYLLNTELLKYSFRSRANQAINQASINQTELGKTSIIIPSLKEQQKIADCISSVDVLIAAQTEKIEDLKSHKKGLIQGLFPSIEEVEA